MDKNLLKFFNYEINAVKLSDNVILSREKIPNGADCFYLNFYDDKGKDLGRHIGFKNLNSKTNEVTSDKKPMSTGGKKPYLMLMINEIEDLRKKDVKNVEELIGYVASMGKYIEWNTGKLIKKRSKKALQYKDLLELYGCSNKKLNKMLKLMKEHDLLYSTDEGYFISQKYIKKGKSK